MKSKCQYCKSGLKKVLLPNDKTCYICFNNECSKYKEGWGFMWKNYKVKASYRHRVNDCNKDDIIAVWSEEALVNCIVEEEEEKEND